MVKRYYADDYVTLYHGDCFELEDTWTAARGGVFAGDNDKMGRGRRCYQHHPATDPLT